MTTTRRRCLRDLGFKLVIVILALLGLEVFVRMVAKAGWVQIRTFQTVNRADDIQFVGDINPHFGAWHKPFASITVDTPRGAISYETNSHGMRDKSRAERSSAAERVVVLGDSFMEGVYVEESDRVTDILEARTGIEFLNFGTSGNFGSIQEWLLYQHLAKQFDHSRVCLFLLPDNDFDDNDPSRHAPDRYRPYLRKVADSYEVFYPVSFQDAPASLGRISSDKIRRHRLYNNWYTLNLVVHRDFSALRPSLRPPVITASYDDFTQADLDTLLFTYRRIVELAQPRPVTIFIIPRDKDFMAHKTGQFTGRILAPLAQFASRYDRVDVVDLMPAFLAYMQANGGSHHQFFLGFDPHWSPLGHRVAAEAVLASLRDAGHSTWPGPVPGAPIPAPATSPSL